MKAGSQFIIALRLLSAYPQLTARLTFVSAVDQLHLFCRGENIQLVENAGLFPISFLLKNEMNDAYAALQVAKDTTSKIEAIRLVALDDSKRQILVEGTRKQISDFFAASVSECKLKLESFKEAPALFTLSQLFYDSGTNFVQNISFEELLPNAQISFKLAPDFIDRTSRIRISKQEGYLLSRLEQTQTLAEILSMVPGDEGPTRKALVTLWAFGVVDSQVLDQLLPKIEGQQPREVPKQEPAAPLPLPDKSARGESVEELKSLIETTYYGLNRQDYYAVLGIPSGAKLDDIKGAYYRLARKFHPDRFYGIEDTIIKEKVDVIFSAINGAYETLKNAKRRLEYDSAPADQRTVNTGGLKSEGKTGAPLSREAQLKKAEDYAKRAQKEYDSGNTYQAVQYLKSATQIAPEVARYWQQLGISLSRNPLWRKEAEDSFLRATELEPKNPENHLYMGFLYKNSGLKLRARKHFASCLELDPGNDIAARELSAINTGDSDAETPTPKKGILGGLFKKK